MTNKDIKTMQVLIKFNSGECAIGMIKDEITKTMVVKSTKFLMLDEDQFETIPLKEIVKNKKNHENN